MILSAFDIADELRTFVDHNLRGFIDDFCVGKNTYRLYHEIETVFLRVALSIQERPVLALGFHFFASDRGYTFLHELGFFDTPRFIDLGGVHRHLVGARRYDVESSVLSGCPDIQVTRHRELLAFAVFGHLREEAGELDVIATDWIAWKYFVHLDISQVFARGFVLHFEIFGGDVADFVSVGGDIYF
jgi:hypothetical protein